MDDYGHRLAAAWQQHLAPRADDAPTVVSTFAGAGGSSLGFSMAGYRELLAVEWDDHAVACFRRNLPGIPVHHGDITHLDPAVLGLAPGALDVLDGSPPCQGFSTIGHRQIDDPRNHLFRQYIRLLNAWQPKVFVMENVSGMIKSYMRLLFAEILGALKSAGYRVVARLVDSSYLGVPQKRQRLIFIGVRSDLGLPPVHPRPSTRPITVRQALKDLADLGPVLVPRGKIARLAPLVHPGQDGADALEARGGKTRDFGLQRAHWDRPCTTLVKTVSDTRNGILHPRESRFLSGREISRIQSFPDAYDWGDSGLEDIWARVGNSVPPLVMRAVASTIREQTLLPSHQLGNEHNLQGQR